MERAGIERVLRNIHESLKWTWQLIMGFALVCAVGEYFNAIKANTTMSIANQPHHLFFLLFILTFIRFLFGNDRYLDERYIEFMFKIDDLEETQRDTYVEERTHKLSGKRRLYDIIMLISTGVIFVILGKSLGTDKDSFVNCYIALMIANICFLAISVVWNVFIEIGHRQTQKTTIQIIVSIYNYERYPIIWIVNNLVCVFIFLLSERLHMFDRYLVFASVFCLNSIIDLCTTWKLYFPPIKISKDGDT